VAFNVSFTTAIAYTDIVRTLLERPIEDTTALLDDKRRSANTPG
jgi:hypothetical protein